MDVKDLIHAAPQLRSAIIAAFVRDKLMKVAWSRNEADQHLADLNPHLTIFFHCGRIVDLVKEELGETIDREFVMMEWLTCLLHHHIQNQIENAKTGELIRLLKGL